MRDTEWLSSGTQGGMSCGTWGGMSCGPWGGISCGPWGGMSCLTLGDKSCRFQVGHKVVVSCGTWWYVMEMW